MKQFLLRIWKIESHIQLHVSICQTIDRVPILGRYITMVLDRILLFFYGIDLDSTSIQIKKLSIAHPSGVLLGGNGIISTGRVAIMADVKFVGKSPDDATYLARHAQKNVFSLGDNVVIGTGATVIGPVTICDNVIIGAMSLVNKDITESGTYVGIPVKKISDNASDRWVKHL